MGILFQNEKIEIIAIQPSKKVKNLQEIENLKYRVEDKKANAKKLLVHYFSLVMNHFDSDNRVEIEEIVENIIEASFYMSIMRMAEFELMKNNERIAYEAGKEPVLTTSNWEEDSFNPQDFGWGNKVSMTYSFEDHGDYFKLIDHSDIVNTYAVSINGIERYFGSIRTNQDAINLFRLLDIDKIFFRQNK